MHLCFFQDSLNIGFSAALSDLALIISFPGPCPNAPFMEKPHFLGQTVRFILLLIAITGTTEEGNISPLAGIACANLPRNLSVSGDRLTCSRKSRTSGSVGSRKNLPHIAVTP